MRLTGFEDSAARMIGVVTPDGAVSPLCPVDTFYADLPHWRNVAATRQSGERRLDGMILAPPVSTAARVFCVGLNYHAHAAESAMEIAPFPTLFARWSASLSVDGAPVPALDDELDWEGELAVIIGEPVIAADPETARKAVFGYAVFNDISARTWQKHTSQWAVGKNMDGSGPIGMLVTADETGDPEDGWGLRTLLNDVVVQDGNTRDMVFGIGAVVSYLSTIIALRPGDVIATGTPDGVGMGRNPPLYMKPGDRIAVEIERVGRIENLIVDAATYRTRYG